MNNFRPEYLDAVAAARWNLWLVPVFLSAPLLLLFPVLRRWHWTVIAGLLLAGAVATWFSIFAYSETIWKTMEANARTSAEIDDVASDTGRVFGPFLLGIPFALFYTAGWLGVMLTARVVAKRFRSTPPPRPPVIASLILIVTAALFQAAGGYARAEQFGLFTYRVVGGEVEIIDFPKDVEGHVEIPSEIEGKPVTAITGGGLADEFDGAFAFSEISSVTIPATVTLIGEEAFGGCFRLTTVTIPDSVTTIGDSAFYQSNGLTNVNFGTSVRSIGDRAFFKCFRLAKLSLPASLETIGPFAFDGCSALTRLSFSDGIAAIGESAFLSCTALRYVVLPASIQRLDNNCFTLCSSLRLAVFLGSAPMIPANSFDRAAAEFQVLFLAGAMGFSTPTWRGFPSEPMSTSLPPVRRWLLENGLPMDTDLATATGGSGTSLLLAYALDPDAERPVGGVQVLAAAPGPLGIRFFGGRPDVTYTVLTSTNLLAWTGDGVTITAPDALGRRTAFADSNPPGRFFRVGASLQTPVVATKAP